MKLNQIRYFLVLCEELNFTRAAKRCGVSQPSITGGIQKLEEEFGGRLFDRHPLSGCRLSGLGLLVRADLMQIDRSVSDAKRKAEKFLARHSPSSLSRPKEAHMHKAIYMTAIATLILVAGLIWQTTPRATASSSGHAGAHIDPYALQMKIDAKTLPEQETEGLI